MYQTQGGKLGKIPVSLLILICGYPSSENVIKFGLRGHICKHGGEVLVGKRLNIIN